MRKFTILIVMALMAACMVSCGQPELYHATSGQKEYEIKYEKSYLYDAETGRKLTDEKVLSFKFYDIDGDSSDELLAVTRLDFENDFGKDLVIYDMYAGEGVLEAKEIYREDFSSIKPWRVDACNLDNDGMTDVFIGVFKSTAFYTDIRKRPFFYSWDGKELSKKWLGSFFTDWDLTGITFGDYYGLGFDAAAVLEKNDEGVYRVGVYKFIGFGFENMYTSKNYSNVKSIETVTEGEKESYRLTFK
jgi:hypothetical protein